MTNDTLESSVKTKPQASLWNQIKYVLKPIASLQLTVTLFSMSLVLVFFGTLAQMNNGIWTVVDQYFWSKFVWIELDLVLKFLQVFFWFPKTWTLPSYVAIPFPAGQLIGFAMLTNLIAAHLVRFRLTWKRSGVMIIHAGLILLFVGEAITRMKQVEQRMVIDEGQTVHFAEDTRTYEFSFEDKSAKDSDTVVVIPEARIHIGERFSDPQLPVDLRIVSYFKNSDMRAVEPGDKNPATAGQGLTDIVEYRPEVSGVSTEQKIDLPSAYVTMFRKGTEESLGTYLLSRYHKPDTLTVDGKKYSIALRNTRYYKPFSVHLNKFRFDRYIGTNKPKNYSSDIRLVDPANEVDREHRIAMNEPLRYGGETFYQGGFDDKTETTTILQVVRNPGWLIPYISCIMVTLGMTIHFGIYLIAFLRKVRIAEFSQLMKASNNEYVPKTGTARYLPWLGIGLAVVFVLYSISNMSPATQPYNLKGLGQIPVVDGGRVKPLDTVARVSLRSISAGETTIETITTANGDVKIEVPAIQWLLDVMTSGGPEKKGVAWKYKVFKIENDQVLALLKLEPRKGLLYALEEFSENAELLLKVASASQKKPLVKRDLYDVKIIEVAERMKVFIELSTVNAPMNIAPTGENPKWSTLPDALEKYRDTAKAHIAEKADINIDNIETLPKEQRALVEQMFREKMIELSAESPSIAFWTGIIQAYRNKKPDDFNKLIEDYSTKVSVPGMSLARTRLETMYNGFAPFYVCLFLYIGAVLLCIASWFGCTDELRRAAFRMLVFTAVIHFVALIARMYLQERWLVFVTNLYSSSIFIGFGCVLLGILLERLYPIGIGNLLGATLGVATTIVSHQIGASGDTLEMMQAVLDTNFWLATHVTCVTFGYTATFVAGALGVIYVIAGMFTPSINAEANKAFGKMLYGVVCFATLLSFVGTVLGGIWADQSWGRFWGWDPKENGAVLIVIWNALILHSRWAGLVKTRGIALLTIVGNMITVWSWFGTNQLGIGLHAYGFDNTLALVCSCLWVSHALLLAIGMTPTKHWMSFAKAPEGAVTATKVVAERNGSSKKKRKQDRTV